MTWITGVRVERIVEFAVPVKVWVWAAKALPVKVSAEVVLDEPVNTGVKAGEHAAVPDPLVVNFAVVQALLLPKGVTVPVELVPAGVPALILALLPRGV